MNLTNTLILGIGNTLLCDEGAGIHALNLLQSFHPDVPNLTFIDIAERKLAQSFCLIYWQNSIGYNDIADK